MLVNDLIKWFYRPRTLVTTSIALSNTDTESQISVPEGAVSLSLRLRATGNAFRIAGSAGGTADSAGFPVASGETFTIGGPLKAATLYIAPDANGLTMEIAYEARGT